VLLPRLFPSILHKRISTRQEELLSLCERLKRGNRVTSDEFIDYIEEKTYPFSFRENGRAKLSIIFRKYPESLLLECVDIGISRYFRYDSNGDVTQESIQEFLDKLGGIAFNRSLSPIAQELSRIRGYCKKNYTYWNEDKSKAILESYVSALRHVKWSDEQILYDLQTEVKRVCNTSRNWTQWSETMEQWIADIKQWHIEDNTTIQESGSVLPAPLFDGVSLNFQSICKQINASYENNLYDCTAVMMRRLLEGLLVLSYQKHGIEDEITESNGRHFSLDKIIKNAEQNNTLSLSANTRHDMALFKDLGNYSAHKIWYNSTKQDIAPHILKYRVIIEELIYKAGMK
jgi:hypothetical protein